MIGVGGTDWTRGGVLTMGTSEVGSGPAGRTTVGPVTTWGGGGTVWTCGTGGTGAGLPGTFIRAAL
jgi:hypothetical protein